MAGSKRSIRSFSLPLPPPPRCLSGGDLWGLAVCLLLLPGVAVALCLGYALQAAPLLLVRAYTVAALARPAADVDRGAAGFRALVAACAVLAAPAVLLAAAWALCVAVAAFALTLPVGLLHPARTRASCAALWPTWGAPGLRVEADGNVRAYPCASWTFTDLVVALAGAMDRQGLCEFAPNLATMTAVTPVLKFVLLANPFLYRLAETHVNQWTGPLDGNGHTDRAAMVRALRGQIHDAILPAWARAATDGWSFAGHHPRAPADRPSQMVLGVQFTRWSTLFSHTTSAAAPAGALPLAPRSAEACAGVLSVWLQGWNPWYQLAGYVEVNARSDGGVEHPMWLLVDQSSFWHVHHLGAVDRVFLGVGESFEAYIRLGRQEGAF